MPERLQLDDRIYNPYSVEDLAQTHPPVFAALETWFKGVRQFDDGPLLRLIAARGPEEVGRNRAAGEAALAHLPEFAGNLDPLIAALEQALAQETAGSSMHRRLSELLEAARHNRKELLERAPALVAQAIASAESYSAAVQRAEALVDATAKKIEAMARASQNSTKSFAELRPMIEELRRIWEQLEAGLAGLPRQEARRIRSTQEPRMKTAASTLCSNLMSSKMRARSSGLLPALGVTAKRDSVVDRFAIALLRGDYQTACALMATWLQKIWTAESLRQRVEEEYAAIAGDSGLPVAPPPGDYEAGSNPLGIADLRRLRGSSRPLIPAEVTEENFLGWVPLSIMPEEEDSYLTNMGYLLSAYVIPVREAGEQRIGYLSLGEG